METKRILSLGSINVDFQVRADRWPEPGEVSMGNEFLMSAGGKGANVAYLARKLGADVRLMARTGDDILAGIARDPLERLGVDLRHTNSIPGTATGAAMIRVQPDGDKSILLAGNANELWRQEDLDDVSAAIAEAPSGSILVADLEISGFVVKKILAAARRRGVAVIFDPSPADRFDADLNPFVDFITPNAFEAEKLTGVRIDTPEDGFRAGEVLLERGVGTALVKLGRGGCIVVGQGVREHVQSREIEPVDTTGSGDAFAGALAVALLGGSQSTAAARFAVAAATLAATRYGAQASYPSRVELEGWLHR